MSAKVSTTTRHARYVTNGNPKHKTLAGPHFPIRPGDHPVADMVPPSSADSARTTNEFAFDVLVVDLDGSLVATDLLVEAGLTAVKKNPLRLAKLIPSLRHGPSLLKSGLAEFVMPDVSQLPYRPEVLELIDQAKLAGIPVVLATASPRRWASAVAEHLGVFQSVLATDANCNLKGDTKRRAIESLCAAEGWKLYAYVGDSRVDLRIWNGASQAFVVGAAPLTNRARQVCASVTSLDTPRPGLRTFARALRMHQWLKNVLLFVPLILAHSLVLEKSLSAVVAFFCWSLCASGVYLVNDLLDIDADRQHPKKRRRAFAAGTLPVAWGPIMAGGLFATSIVSAAVIMPKVFTISLLGYVAATFLYSVWLKQLMVIDVVVLAGLYVIRILAGGLATGTPVSEWLLTMSMFMFLSLAFVKRYSELARLSDQGADNAPGRSYLVQDLATIESVGPCSGYLSVLVLAMYINSPAMQERYANAWALWLMCPLVLYWITRVWFLARRRQLNEDPIVFAIRDRVSRVVLAGVAIFMVIAVGLPQR